MKWLLPFVLLMLPSVSWGQPCGSTQASRELLTKVYKEEPTGAGISASGVIVEVWRSKEVVVVDGKKFDRSFTIMISGTDKVSCRVLHGQEWEDRPDLDEYEEQATP